MVSAAMEGNMYFDRQFAVPHLASLLIALGFLVVSIRRPRLARKLFAGLFMYASVVNGFVCWLAPRSYVNNARYALVDFYRHFINGWFAEHVTLLVGAVALAQAAIALGLMAGGWAARAALVGAIGFFVAIAPLGVGSAFPASLVWAAGAAWLLARSVARAAIEGPLVELSGPLKSGQR